VSNDGGAAGSGKGGVTGVAENSLVKLRPRNDTVYVSQGRVVLATGLDGFVSERKGQGLLVYQTRMLSRYRYLIDGEQPGESGLSNVGQFSWLGYYTTLTPNSDEGRLKGALGPGGRMAEQTVELRLSRYIGGGVHEDVDLRNYTLRPANLTLTLEIEPDFSDQTEQPGMRKAGGETKSGWGKVEGDEAWELYFVYEAEHAYDHQGETGRARLCRGLTVRVEKADSAPTYRCGRISFPVALGPQGSWHACVKLIPSVEDQSFRPVYDCYSFRGAETQYDRKRRLFLGEATHFTSPEKRTLTHVALGALNRAVEDLAAMRLYDLDRGDRSWTVAAGLPVYISLFGRDTLTASWQSALAGTEMMRGTLSVLAETQAEGTNDWRDAQPGRMIHQAETGPLAALNFNPHARYYGTVTSPGFFPFILAELWRWTGDGGLVRPLVGPALKGLKWLDDRSRRGDGFYYYETRSNQGVKNQAWKDAYDSIVYEDGRVVENPIATCEQQGYVYLAKQSLSEVLWWQGREDEAARLFGEAEELKKRFNETFWMEEKGTFAMGLDPEGRQIKSVGSNPGHCLTTGIADEGRVGQTVGRLTAADMFSGWGVRTLSSKHPAYDPFSYHRGSVWPVEQGSFALGFARYGLTKHLHALTKAVFEAASLFEFYRLPEVFGGHQRDERHPFPALYPMANSPQAWSASTVFCLVQALLGLCPYAPLNMLLVDPHLPEWLPQITLEHLRVGGAAATIRFYRQPGGESSYEVEDVRGSLHVLRQPGPWALTAGRAGRVKDALTSLLPDAGKGEFVGMGKRYTVVQSSTQPDGQVFHVVAGPGGEITVKEDNGGNLSASTRPGYVGNQGHAAAHAIEAVRDLRARSRRDRDPGEFR
jgi:glycogen debranching enzyme